MIHAIADAIEQRRRSRGKSIRKITADLVAMDAAQFADQQLAGLNEISVRARVETLKANRQRRRHRAGSQTQRRRNRHTQSPERPPA